MLETTLSLKIKMTSKKGIALPARYLKLNVTFTIEIRFSLKINMRRRIKIWWKVVSTWFKSCKYIAGS